MVSKTKGMILLSKYTLKGSKYLRLVKITDLHLSKVTENDRSLKIELSLIKARLINSTARLKSLFERKTTMSSV